MDRELKLAELISIVPKIEVENARYDFETFDDAPLEHRISFARKTFENAKDWLNIARLERARKEAERQEDEERIRAAEEAEARLRENLRNNLEMFKQEIEQQKSEIYLEKEIAKLKDMKADAQREVNRLLVDHISEKIDLTYERLIAIERKSKIFNKIMAIGGLIVGVVGAVLGLL
jgi:hypothetical protein